MERNAASRRFEEHPSSSTSSSARHTAGSTWSSEGPTSASTWKCADPSCNKVNYGEETCVKCNLSRDKSALHRQKLQVFRKFSAKKPTDNKHFKCIPGTKDLSVAAEDVGIFKAKGNNISESVTNMTTKEAINVTNMTTPNSNFSHQIKQINFDGPYRILTQNDECQQALQSLANALLLRSSIQLPSNVTTISNTELVRQISNLLLPASKSNDSSSAMAQDFGEMLCHVEVDPEFTGVQEFSPTPGVDVFSMLKVRLFHTCVLDPDFSFLTSMVEGLSLSQLRDKIVAYKASGDRSKIEDAEAALDYIQWMGLNQMYGVLMLMENMEEKEIAVLFQDGKFSTIYKRDGVVYQLVTDDKYLKREDIVWETICGVRGDSKFVGQDWNDLKYSPTGILVEKLCPHGHSLKLKRSTIQSEPSVWKCDCCGITKSCFDISYQCDQGEVCNYHICGGCYFGCENGKVTTDGAEKLPILLEKKCPQGHNLLFYQGDQASNYFHCACCDKSLEGKQIHFPCNFPNTCSYIICGKCFYDDHDLSCGVRKQVKCPDWVKEGVKLSIIVTQVESPAKFWFQLKGFGTNRALKSLMKEMDGFYSEKEEECRLESGNPRAVQDWCEPGAIMAAPFECEGYHRVRINKIDENNNVEVFYVDYGTTLNVSMSEIRILPTKFRFLPSQAIEGKLWGLVPPGSEKTWSSKSTAKFLDLVNGFYRSSDPNSRVRRIQTDSFNYILHLEVYVPKRKGQTKISLINKVLVSEGLAEDESSSVVSTNSSKQELSHIQEKFQNFSNEGRSDEKNVNCGKN